MMHYICINIHENILVSFTVIEQTLFSYEKFHRGIILQILKVELQFLFSANNLMMLYICTKFHKNILDSCKVMEQA